VQADGQLPPRGFFADHDSKRVLIGELSGIEIAAIGFQHRADFLDHVTAFALRQGEIALQDLNVGPLLCLRRLFDVPFRDRRVCLVDAPQLKRLAVGGRELVPHKLEEERIMRKNDHLRASFAEFGEWCRLAPDDIMALRALKANPAPSGSR
jgi:hypothetical protein